MSCGQQVEQVCGRAADDGVSLVVALGNSTLQLRLLQTPTYWRGCGLSFLLPGDSRWRHRESEWDFLAGELTSGIQSGWRGRARAQTVQGAGAKYSINCVSCAYRVLLWLAPALLQQPSALERGAAAIHSGDAAAAVPLLEQAVREQPRNAFAQKLLGMAYSIEERYAEAQPHLLAACTLNPREESACYYLGRANYLLNRFEDSLTALQSALRTGSSSRSRTLLAVAFALEGLGRNREAERAFRDAAAKGSEPEIKEAQKAYGMFLYHCGRVAESQEILRKAGAEAELRIVSLSLRDASPRRPLRETPAEVRFEPRALDMIVRNGAQGNKHQIETMIAGVAVFDYDSDGWPDIFVGNGARIPDLVKADDRFHNRLFRNNRDGTFTDVTGHAGLAGTGYSMGIAAADYDNDGWVDLFVAGVRGNTLYRNRGDGTFSDVTSKAGLPQDGLWAIAAGWLDYDNDGLLDLLVVRYVEWNPETEPFCGLHRPGHRTYCHPKYYRALPNALYHNEGGGRLRDVSLESGIGKHEGKGMGVVFGDYDGDGRLDVFVANDTVPNFLFHNEGNGRFKEVAVYQGVALNESGTSSSSMGADFRDYDNDGREDVFVAALTNERFSLFRNTKQGGFVDDSGRSRISSESLAWSGWSTGIFDFNNDGWKDIFVAGGNVMDNAELTSSIKSRQPNMVFVNRGDGTFTRQALPGEAFHRGAAFGDFDRDGRMDVVVTRLNEPPLVLLNVSPTTRQWLELRLEGRRSNRDAIGALVQITTAEGEQWNRLSTSVGYAGSSDRVVHFGLGKEARISALQILWPSGSRQTLHDVVANRVLVIEEPTK